MMSYIKERTLKLAAYVEETQSTVRKTAKIFKLSKSTVHNDLSKRLKKVDFKQYERVQKILDKNFSEKHIRGGEATKRKYQTRELMK